MLKSGGQTQKKSTQYQGANGRKLPVCTTRATLPPSWNSWPAAGEIILIATKQFFLNITSSPFLIGVIALSDRINPNLDNFIKIVDPVIRK